MILGLIRDGRGDAFSASVSGVPVSRDERETIEACRGFIKLRDVTSTRFPSSALS